MDVIKKANVKDEEIRQWRMKLYRPNKMKNKYNNI
jgi:hypothetical protein